MDARVINREVKVCPVVLRNQSDEIELLLFQHPLAGVQIVKGTLEEDDESVESAVLRELKEESGISQVSGTEYMCCWESGYQDQLWHFVRCDVIEVLPERWDFFTQDDGGLTFSFFWHKLGNPMERDCYKLFSDAIKKIESMLVAPTSVNHYCI
ncbi:NUDIX domain [Vibrio sp. B1FLJ16]|uniref:NUDIX hydrolase n=1 Tax=Vibrio sp. B1FLJ16 TaxID=2751178 RepID=UPI0015F38143|nr:NUDIX domain-containing protein [Vibrio sp. B1FLJ16]CAD7822336.1 NUDIX domain [Vibrio sp. B1FLJ16]CAE6948756.1 NUDIX domain [Vibrio sp. B1FLJ16]